MAAIVYRHKTATTITLAGAMVKVRTDVTIKSNTGVKIKSYLQR
jgi:hypothetical protein